MNENIIKNFMHSWESFETLRGGYAQYLDDDCLWENTGLKPIRGKNNCLALVDRSIDTWGRYSVQGVCKNLVAQENTVFVERRDVMKYEDGTIFCEVPIAGVFEVKNGKIARWSDYYDPKNMLKAMGEAMKKKESGDV